MYPRPPGDEVGDDHAGGRSRLHHVGRLLGPGFEGQHSAAGLHDQELARHPLSPQPLLDPLQIAGDHRPDAGVDDGGAGAEVLPEFGADDGRERDDQARVPFPQYFADPQLVCRIQIGVQEADGHRNHAFPFQLGGDLAHPLLVQGQQHVPLGIQSFGDLEAEVAWNQRPGLLEMDVVEGRPDLPCDLQHVAEASGGDEGAAGRLPFDQGVGGHRRAVHQVGNLLRFQAILQDPVHRVHETDRGIAGSRGDLGGLRFAGLLRDQDRVGEGASHVDAHSKSGFHSSLPLAFSFSRSLAVSPRSTVQSSVSTDTP